MVRAALNPRAASWGPPGAPMEGVPRALHLSWPPTSGHGAPPGSLPARYISSPPPRNFMVPAGGPHNLARELSHGVNTSAMASSICWDTPAGLLGTWPSHRSTVFGGEQLAEGYWTEPPVSLSFSLCYHYLKPAVTESLSFMVGLINQPTAPWAAVALRSISAPPVFYR